MTREEWLNAGLTNLRPWFRDRAGVEIPSDTRVSVGFPGGGSARKRIGECWARRMSKDNVNEIFINPTLSDPVQMLDVLAHGFCPVTISHNITPKENESICSLIVLF